MEKTEEKNIDTNINTTMEKKSIKEHNKSPYNTDDEDEIVMEFLIKKKNNNTENEHKDINTDIDIDTDTDMFDSDSDNMSEHQNTESTENIEKESKNNSNSNDMKNDNRENKEYRENREHKERDKMYNYPVIITDYMYIQNNTFPHREDEYIEFKDKKLTDLELSKIFSGFSNSLGGTLFIGIADDRKINGRKMTDKQIDEFKLFVDNVQQNCTNPPMVGIKINIVPVYTQDLTPIPETYIVKIDIPKLNMNICALDGEKYVRFNASFRCEGNKTFVRIGEYQSIQDKYNKELEKNKDLKKNLDESNKKNDELGKKICGYKKIDRKYSDEKNKNTKLEEKIKSLQEELQKMTEKNKSLENKIQNYDIIFGEYTLVKKTMSY
jgi:hypothetical protein